jgi:hypothetical protein
VPLTGVEPFGHNCFVRQMDQQERAEIERLEKMTQEIRTLCHRVRDVSLLRMHSLICRGVTLREIARAVCRARGLKTWDDVAIVTVQLKEALHRFRQRTKRPPCSPRRSRRARMPTLLPSG